MLVRGTLVTLPAPGDLQILNDHLLRYITHHAPFSAPSSQALLSSSSDELTTLPPGTFLLPSFVDLHLHAPQFLHRGTGFRLPLTQGSDATALDAEERLDNDLALAQRVFTQLSSRLVENGTGSAVLFSTTYEKTNLILAEAMQKAGLRAYISKPSVDIAQSADVLPTRPVPRCFDSACHYRPYKLRRIPHTLLSRCISFLETKWNCSNMPPTSPDTRAPPAPATNAHTLAGGLGMPLIKAADAVSWDPRSADKINIFDHSVALGADIKAGLGTDIAGGYNLDIMNAMRWAVDVARMHEDQVDDAGEATGDLNTPLQGGGGDSSEVPVLDWKGALYLATRGGSEALGLSSGSGTFDVGAPFDAQLIHLFEPKTGMGIGNLDFFDLVPGSQVDVDAEMVEKWWSVGDTRNRIGMWVQGKPVGKW